MRWTHARGADAHGAAAAGSRGHHISMATRWDIFVTLLQLKRQDGSVFGYSREVGFTAPPTAPPSLEIAKILDTVPVVYRAKLCEVLCMAGPSPTELRKRLLAGAPDLTKWREDVSCAKPLPKIDPRDTAVGASYYSLGVQCLWQ